MTPILQLRDNGWFYACWTVGRRSYRRSMNTKDRTAAEARFAHWLLIGGHHIVADNATPVFTVAECWSVYDAKHVQRNVVATETTAYCWRSLEPHFGALTVAQVNQDQVDAYVAKRTSGRLGRAVKPQTCRKELAALFAALRFCARKPQAMFSSTIIEDVVLPEDGEPRDRWLKTDEMQRMIDAAARLRRGSVLTRGERFLWLALETAARKQAIMELTWDRVDLETGTIHYDVPGAKRTSKRRSSVPISRALRPILARAYMERQNELVMGAATEIWPVVKAIAKEARVADVSPHTLRHTAATHMARRGVPLWKIAKILGNTLAMVERVYAKWAPEDAAGTVDLISAGMLETQK